MAVPFIIGGAAAVLGVTGVKKAIDASNVTYYISNKELTNLTNYTKIKDINDMHLYEKSV